MRLVKAKDGQHKWVAVFKDGHRQAFGAAGMDDYTLTHNPEQREAYIRRHLKDLETGDHRRAGFLSMFVLWGPTTSVRENAKFYSKHFKE